MRLFYCSVLFFALSLSGCATDPSFCPPHPKSTNYWTMSASMAIQTGDPVSSGSFQVEWLQRGNQYTINGSGPLGATLFILTSRPGQVVLQTVDGRVLRASTPEQLVRNQLGWQWPVSNMAYWMNAQSVPHQRVNKVFDSDHHLVQLVQQGWTVNFSQFQMVSGITLPTRIVLEKGVVKIKLVIHQWLLC